MNYIEYIREYISLHLGMLLPEGMVKYSQELVGKPFKRTLYSAEPAKDRSWWNWWKKDIDIMGRFLVENSKDQEWLRKFVELHKKVSEDAENIAKKVKETKLVEFYPELRAKKEMFHALFMAIDAVDIELEIQLKEKIAGLFKTKKDQNEAYAAITTPSELSFPKKEEFLLYKLALKLKEDKKFDEDLLNQLLNNFWWSELSWRAKNEKTKEKVKDGIKKIIKETKDIKKHILQLEAYKEEISILKEKYLFDKELIVLNTIFEEFAVLHERRKEVQLKTTYSIYIILKELGKKFNIPLEHLELYTPDEVTSLIKEEKQLSKEELNNRLECTTILIDGDKMIFKTGKEAVKLRETELSGDIGDIRDFTGLPASRGKAVGKVKVALSAAEALNKVNKGDVLVTGMTLPDFVPAMKNAAAIITNEGGATCHAAIISREFNIPCIVGTKIATKILKDGMMVEVNANHGVVKIIKQ